MFRGWETAAVLVTVAMQPRPQKKKKNENHNLQEVFRHRWDSIATIVGIARTESTTIEERHHFRPVAQMARCIWRALKEYGAVGTVSSAWQHPPLGHTFGWTFFCGICRQRWSATALLPHSGNPALRTTTAEEKRGLPTQ